MHKVCCEIKGFNEWRERGTILHFTVVMFTLNNYFNVIRQNNNVTRMWKPDSVVWQASISLVSFTFRSHFILVFPSLASNSSNSTAV